MKKNKTKSYINLILCSFGIVIASGVSAMGLRTFVALPVEKDGGVFRFLYDYNNDSKQRLLNVNVAYGLSSNQTFLMSIPYIYDLEGKRQLDELSFLYRNILWKDDRLSGTTRIGFLGGALLPSQDTQNTSALLGFVVTHFNERHEIDFDVLYNTGSGDKAKNVRYDLSWQYRLSPNRRPDWGLATEFNSVLEINNRWIDGKGTSNEITIGLQWIHPSWVLEGGVVQGISGSDDMRYILSTRFHF